MERRAPHARFGFDKMIQIFHSLHKYSSAMPFTLETFYMARQFDRSDHGYFCTATQNTRLNPSIVNFCFSFFSPRSSDGLQPGEPVAQSSPHTNVSNNNSYQNGNGYYQDANNTTAESDNGERGRQRKKRDFFGTLKRRLGRSKSRAKSSERSMIPIDADNPNGELRSVSADRTPSGTLGNNIGGGITFNTSTGNYLLFHFELFTYWLLFCPPTLPTTKFPSVTSLVFFLSNPIN